MTPDLLERPSASAPAGPGSATEAPPATDAGELVQCPECPFTAKSQIGLKIHFRKTHSGIPEPQWTERPRKLEADAPPAADVGDATPSATRSATEFEGIRRKTVESLQNLGGLCFVVGLQVTGVALDNRAERLSWQAIAYAQRSDRFCALLEAFNEVMTTGEMIKLGSELGMAVGVDVGVLHPARPVRLGPITAPGFVFLRPIAQDMAQVDQLRQVATGMAQQYEKEMAAAQAAQNGIRPQDAAAGQ